MTTTEREEEAGALQRQHDRKENLEEAGKERELRGKRGITKKENLRGTKERK